jgi:hypothetical protein
MKSTDLSLDNEISETGESSTVGISGKFSVTTGAQEPSWSASLKAIDSNAER